MLKLKRLELQGFKSFCDRTELRFNGHGIAAVVGPNGCGKSNLGDAISWVLGEQSARSLRGTRMDDVIFAGTRDRKPVGMASVTMTLVDPSAQQAPVAEPDSNGNGNGNGNGKGNGHAAPTRTVEKAGEITVTRRLFRSGESEYLIDGRAARLRDIQDLFMGTGLGPESYAIIEQGRIGQILSSKPQDRRSVIEEAAGITKFKAKRRLAEAKLESARQNLTRVFDILEEVGRQVGSLKRQAAKARRYGELKEDMAVQLRRALTGRYRLLERDAAKTALDLNLATAEFQSLARRVAEKEQEHRGIQAECYRTESELTQARKRLADMRLEAERARGRLENQAAQIGSIEERLGQGEGEAQELERRLAVLQADLDAHRKGAEELELQAGSVRERLAAKNQEREALQTSLRERERAMEEGRQRVLRLLGEAAQLKNQLAQIEEYLAGVDRASQRERKEAEAATADLERLAAARNALAEKAAARKGELEAIVSRRAQVEGELASRRAGASEARARLDLLRSDASRLKARKDSLEEILSHRAYTTESVKRLFTAVEHGQAGDLRPGGVLADFVEVDPAYEKAAEEFLHDELEYVLVKNWDEADRGIDLLRRDLEGRATFLVHPEADADIGGAAGAEPPIGPETGIAARLSDVLRLTNGLTSAPAELLPRLSRCFIAEDRAAAQRLGLAYPDFYFLLPDGVCYHGHAVSGGKKTGSGPLALKRELREITALAQSSQRELEETAGLLETLEREIAALENEVETLRAKQQSGEKEALAIEHEMRKLGEEHSRAASRLSVARDELERLGRESERSASQREASLALVASKEQARYSEEQSLRTAREEMETLEAESARIGEEHSALRAELAGLDERRRAQRAVEQRLEGQAGEVVSRQREIAAELERLGVERARLLASNIELDARCAALEQDIAREEEGVAALASQEEQLRASLAEAGEALQQMRLEVQAAQETRSAAEVELVRRQSELRFLDETSRKELGFPIQEVAQGDDSVLDEIGLAEAEQKYQDVKARIEALGAVNPQALEEYQEAQQRYDFLNTQRQDLLDSIKDTEKAIHDIDAETRKRFSEAFEAINANFREMFKALFGGGTGEMRLTDETNLAESGIDIVASPPGKRLQNVLLLSGGEKALTALALLMAIFRYQPSPFCILDEVDAPLDEPNIQRLTELLREMSRQTQFIIITHAKRTMEAAQAMYGVTMQEPGVSKLVTVRFQPAPSPPVPPPPTVPAALPAM